MNHLKIVRSLDAPVERVWAVVGNPGVSPGPGVDVEVERPGAPDGSGLTRVVKVGRVTAHEEIVGVEPGRVVRYRATKGVPARDYEGKVSVEESPGGGTTVSWDRPVPADRTGHRVADLVAHEAHAQPRAGRRRRQLTRLREAGAGCRQGSEVELMSRRQTDRGFVVVTGTSTGIGAATALHLAGKGFHVFAGVRREADGEALQAQSSARLTPLIIDVTDAETISAAAAAVTDVVGDRGLAGLVNNAGIAKPAPLEFQPMADFRTQLEVNLFGPVAMIQAFLPLIRRGGGRIVNVGSIGGHARPPAERCLQRVEVRHPSDQRRTPARAAANGTSTSL